MKWFLPWIAKYKWIVVVLVAVPLLLLGAFDLYWYARFARSEHMIAQNSSVVSGEAVDAPPLALAADYDPSENAGMYSVEAVEQASGQVTLVYAWPHAFVDEVITPVVSCPIWDSKLFDLGKKVPRYVSRETLLSVMAETPKNQLTFSGKCSDGDCTMIDRECQLFITRPKQDETP